LLLPFSDEERKEQQDGKTKDIKKIFVENLQTVWYFVYVGNVSVGERESIGVCVCVCVEREYVCVRREMGGCMVRVL
jgi:hypothetical protein